MAKRKRLTPAQPGYLGPEPPVLETKSMGFPATPPSAAPIAQVAGEAASAAALEELAGEMQRARDEGRMIQAIALDLIDEGYLKRDRISVDNAELVELKESLANRGQQTPIEVVAHETGRYGLISGWRRLTALRQLCAETGNPRFATIQAILRSPGSTAEAYVAMVEENEIRLGLSYYERARIAAKAVAEGVYGSEKEALQDLFRTASRAKRSKIGAFLVIYHKLDDVLRFPNALTERLGIQLSHQLEDETGFAEALRRRLSEAPADSAEAELETLRGPVAPSQSAPQTTLPETQPAAPAPAFDQTADPQQMPGGKTAQAQPSAVPQAPRQVNVTRLGKDRLMVTGAGVTPAFQEKLMAWIAAQS